MSRRVRRACLWLPLVLAAFGAGCASTGESYINPNMDFGYVRRCAVVPFQNLGSDDLADERIQSIFMTEVLDQDVLEIIDPGETRAAMLALRLSPGTELGPEDAVALGDKLNVDGIFFGVVEEYGISSTDRRRGPEVTLVLGMMETETGSTVWRSQVHETGTSFWKRLFGGAPASLYAVSRKAVRKALNTLF